MDFKIKHEIRGRLRVHILQNRMTCQEADALLYYLHSLDGVTEAKVYERTGDAVILYKGERETVIQGLKSFCYAQVEVPEGLIEHSGRELNAKYQGKLVQQTAIHFGKKLFIPYSVRAMITMVKSIKYIYRGFRCLLQKKMEVPVLDAIAIGVSVFRGEMDTASSVMYLLGIGETLEEWTHKKSVDDLARSMSLNISKVWLLQDGQEVLVSAKEVEVGDSVVVHMGSIIPFDGEVRDGEAMINQASMTGESMPVRKEKGGYVYAGTVVEEGEIILQVKETKGSTRFEKIVTMIEDSEKLKSAVESRAEHLADRLVPYTLIGTGLVYAVTRNVTKALAVLMVDFSCALKLAMPLSVLSAIREAGLHHITVKGGKYLEAVADAKTIVFDKTGTLTKAKPTVKEVYSFCDQSIDEVLRIAACMEEHFPHSMAKAVVTAAQKKGLEHEEMHSKVEYIVAHGIATTIDEKRAIIGSYHFVFEDEGCTIDPRYQEQFEALPEEYSRLFLAIDYKLAAVICIEDPLREEAADVIQALKAVGFEKVVMMTGDNKYAAEAIAAQVGVDEFYYEVLPEDKANYILRETEKGNKVIMIGDGINDSPALSAADAGIAISDGAELAREIADITIAADDLYEIVKLKVLSDLLMKRIQRNYNLIVGINASLIVLGVAGVLMPTTSALFHNASTLAISLKGMSNLLVES
ncbi:MAG: heavy metal translocating P-type ATPase [Anaerotignum sp.]|nr:heavy metal translocating P-type ATPase [Anaerotignum sp.]